MMSCGFGSRQSAVDNSFQYGGVPLSDFSGTSSGHSVGAAGAQTMRSAGSPPNGQSKPVTESSVRHERSPNAPTNFNERSRMNGALSANTQVVFLHHSVGEIVWQAGVSEWFAKYNERTGKGYAIDAKTYPDGRTYPWTNYPFDYWNLWVAHAGASAYSGQATLEILTNQYQVIIWKHSFPVSSIEPDLGAPDIASDRKSLENYGAQYLALREKMRQFPTTRFIVWTGGALKASESTPEQGALTSEFFDWITTTWDEPGDNIYVWDFFRLETQGGVFLAPANAGGDSHPNSSFAKRVAPMFAQRIVDVIEGRGDATTLTGE